MKEKKKSLGLGKATWKKIWRVETHIISQLFYKYDVIEYVVEKKLWVHV